MAYGRSNDDVTWLWKVKVMIPISLRPVISKTAWDRDSRVQRGTIGNGTRGRRGIESSRDRWRHVTRQMPCWFHNQVFKYSFNKRTRVIRDSKTKQLIVSDRLYNYRKVAEWWLLSSCRPTKKLQMAILKIPGNSRGNFRVVKFPGIPGNSRTGIPGGLERSQR